ncbi:E3 ubiquitin-protein ligase TRAIP-like [Saccostrea cucullata]|uniref:E3 ubiquitin-protein ligase TRAIP-like n=1 Tax=Saccostrea cuccullata TaxID=36930 RepID=UPI002ED115C4
MTAQCNICSDFFVNDPSVTITAIQCGHTFHKPCMTNWLRKSKTCPSCQTQVDPIQVINQLHFDGDDQQIRKIEKLKRKVKGLKDEKEKTNNDMEELKTKYKKIKAEKKIIKAKLEDKEKILEDKDKEIEDLKMQLKSKSKEDPKKSLKRKKIGMVRKGKKAPSVV